MKSLEAGHRLAGRYTILREIGRGGCGVVYLAVQESIQRPVAIKMLHISSKALNATQVFEAFRIEALHTSRLSHPNTVTVFDFGETDDGMLYLVMEYLKGKGLSEILDHLGMLSNQATMRIARQIARSLAEAHEIGLVHGDLKPDNIMICEHHGEPYFTKVLDFSIAQFMGLTTDGFRGTPGYMAPEQFESGELGPATDIFALGVLIYEMLTGRRAIQTLEGPPSNPLLWRLHDLRLPEGIVGVPALNDIVAIATRERPEERYATGAAILKDLELIDQSLLAQSSGLWPLVFPRPDDSVPPSEDEIFGLETWPSLDNIEADGSASLFLGREKDLENLSALVEEVRQTGRGRILLLSGPNGVGKTTLARHLMASFSEGDGLNTGMGSYEGGGYSNPVGLADALADLLGHERKIGEQPQLPAIFDSLQARLQTPLTSELQSTLLGLFGWSVRPFQPREAELTRAFLADMVESASEPTLLYLDAVERADPWTLLVIEKLASMLDAEPLPLVLVCALRNEGEAFAQLQGLSSRYQSVMRATLSPISLEGQHQLIRALFLTSRRETLHNAASPALIEFIVECCDGNPGLIRDQIAFMLLDESLTLSDEGLTFADFTDLVLPPVVQEKMSARLDAILDGHEAREDLSMILLRSAILGRTFSQEILEHLLFLEVISGHKCAQRALDNLDDLLGMLDKSGIIHRLRIKSGKGPRPIRWRFGQTSMRHYLNHIAAEVDHATVLHHLAASAKTRFKNTSAQPTPQHITPEQHKSLAARPLPHCPVVSWPLHKDCWKKLSAPLSRPFGSSN